MDNCIFYTGEKAIKEKREKLINIPVALFAEFLTSVKIYSQNLKIFSVLSRRLIIKS